VYLGGEDMSCECSNSSTNNNSNSNRSANCVTDIVRFINRLQQNVVSTEIGCSQCNTPVLGETSRANTRPFILYLPNGQPFRLATLTDGSNASIPVFRVEEVNGNCATLRALTLRRRCCVNNQPSFNDLNDFNVEETELIPTRTCVTVNLNDFMGIQTLNDIFLKLDVCDCI